jgi:hypothetical protein
MKQISLLQGWTFRSLVNFLERGRAAVVISRVDSPNARCTVSILNHVIELEYTDPWGVTLMAPARATEPLLEEIAADLEQYPVEACRHLSVAG